SIWLGHESIETTQIYLDANLVLKEEILAKTNPLKSTNVRYRPGVEGDEEHSPLHLTMEKMGETYKNLARALRNPDPAAKADLLNWLQKLELGAIEAKQYVPASIEKLPAAEQPAQIAAFRADLIGTIETMLQLERAILAEDWERVKTLGREISAQRRDSHKKYNPEEEKP
ncbi:MAG: cytochrome b562, partial [Opitutaceae bacterium]